MIDVILVDQPVIDRIPQSHPRLLGSKQRGPLQWGGVQVITCTLQELDWFTYLRSGLVGISGAIFSSFHFFSPFAALYYFRSDFAGTIVPPASMLSHLNFQD